VLIVRNSELHPARSAMREVEDRFNKRFGYPWVFVNDEPFTDEYALELA
jgi:alpha 1,2-mannosyltransferase